VEEEEHIDVARIPALRLSRKNRICGTVISINRITKVTKGGKKLSFSALVVVGDTRTRGVQSHQGQRGSVAIKKSIAAAKKNMICVPLKGTTIAHEIIGMCGAAQVLLKPASKVRVSSRRTGPGGVRRGRIRNILTKCHRSNNPSTWSRPLLTVKPSESAQQ